MSVTRIDLDELETANRYLSGRLSEAECAAFENRLTREPELIRELEAMARFKVGLQVLDERGQLEEATRAPGWPRLLAVAAAVGVLAIGALMFRTVVTPTEPSLLAAVPAALMDRQGNVLLPSTGALTVLRKRATTADAVIELPPQGHALEVRVLPESPPAKDGYGVSLWQQPQGAAAAKLASLAHVSASEDGFLTVFMDATRLTPGEYLLIVSPADGENSPSVGDVFRISLIAPRK